jgi:hypothetical protein
MRHAFWVIPGKLAGRCGPSVEAWDMAAIRDAGITVVVSLDEDCWASTIRDAGLRHHALFMPQIFPTTPQLVSRFADMTREISRVVLAELRAGESVLAHCLAGRDRTGLVICATLMELENLSAKEALKRLRAVRPEALTSPGVLDVLVEYEARLHAGYWAE